jgi:hypothetical protein
MLGFETARSGETVNHAILVGDLLTAIAAKGIARVETVGPIFISGTIKSLLKGTRGSDTK